MYDVVGKRNLWFAISAITVTRTLLRYVTRTTWGRRLELYHVER